MSDLGFGNVSSSLNSGGSIDEEKQKTKKLLIMIVAAMFFLAIIVVVLLVLISKGEKPKLSLNIDGTVVTANEVFYQYDNEAGAWFFSVKDLANRLNYTYNRGGIVITDESESNCTIVNPNKYEKVLFESNKQEIVKYYISKDALVPNQHFDIKYMIRYDTNNKRILADQSAIERAFNCSISYNEQTMKLSIQTLEGTLIRAYSETNQAAANNQREYTTDEIRFQNNKALLRNLLVVKDQNTGLYGIEKYDDASATYVPVISTKYKSFQFIEGINKFVAQGENNRYGILDETGVVDVDLAYTYLFCIDIKHGLYVAGTDSGKQCVVSGASAQSGRTSKIVVPADYEKIGLSGNNLNDDRLESEYILCNSLIPVQKNGKWGFYSLDGTRVIDPIYDGVGCPTPKGDVTGGRANIRGCAVIPDINAIVIQVDKEIPDERGNKRITAFYGLINYKGELKVQTDNITAIYSSTENNKRTYYCGNDDQQIDVISYWMQNNLGDTIYTTRNDQGFGNTSTNEVNTVDQQNSVVNTIDNQTVNSTNDTNDANVTQQPSVTNQAVPVLQN